MPRVRDQGHGPFGIVFGAAHPGQAIPSRLDRDSAHLVQQCVFIRRVDDRTVAARQQPQSSIGLTQLRLGLRAVAKVGLRGLVHPHFPVGPIDALRATNSTTTRPFSHALAIFVPGGHVSDGSPIPSDNLGKDVAAVTQV